MKTEIWFTTKLKRFKKSPVFWWEYFKLCIVEWGLKLYPISRCPYCNSIWVRWNWIHAWGGDRKKYEELNPHIAPKDLKDWGHECWDCEGCNETFHKVQNGISYWVLKTFYDFWRKLIPEKGETK